MVRRVFMLLLLALAVPSTALARDQGSDIVGGHGPSRDYPYQVLVEPSDHGFTYLCGGTLVAARFVITAAHCVTSDFGTGTVDSVDVAVGITGLNAIPGDRVYRDVGVRRDPLYNASNDTHDVAVLTLPRPAPGAQLRLPRPSDSALWAAGVNATAIGWGTTAPGGDVSDQLLEVEIPIITDTQCAQQYGSHFNADTMLCAYADGKDTCQGDSGGPLLAPDAHSGFVLAGVTSWGEGCGSHPGVYARAGGTLINAWLRTKIPQVELTQSTASPAVGQEVTFTADPHDPYGSGPFGGYDTVDWDLDGDGGFDDAKDVLSVSTPIAGRSVVSVRARRSASNPASSDEEIRTLANDLSAPSPVNFTAADVTVTEGQAVTLGVTKTGTGTGSVTVTPHPGTAAADADLAGTPQTLAFSPGQTAQTASISTVDDAVVEGPETFRVDLGGHSGDLTPASPGSVNVTILDNDVAPPPTAKLRGVKGRTIRVMTGGGRLHATAKDRAGHVLAQALTRRVDEGSALLKLRLTPRGHAALRRQPQVNTTLRVVYEPSGEAPGIVLKRKLTLKR